MCQLVNEIDWVALASISASPNGKALVDLIDHYIYNDIEKLIKVDKEEVPKIQGMIEAYKKIKGDLLKAAETGKHLEGQAGNSKEPQK